MSYSSLQIESYHHPILVFGKDGQVGLALQELFKEMQIDAIFLGRDECDLSKTDQLIQKLDHFKPKIIINAAAYTAVDKAETQVDLANAINAEAPKIIADYVSKISKGALVHFSTNYVFDGRKASPYLESDVTNPMSVYGNSKLLGEHYIQEAFHENTSSKYFILRTSWVYGDGKNFIRTMLKLATQKDQLRVIADQFGVPSSAAWLARISAQLAVSQADSGIYHTVPDGECTWHSLAVYAIELARKYGEGVLVSSENIQAITTDEYPLPAPRPKNSRMDHSKLKLALSNMPFSSNYPHWQEQVEEYVKNEVENALKS